jgi:hypothetical protein
MIKIFIAIIVLLRDPFSVSNKTVGILVAARPETVDDPYLTDGSHPSSWTSGPALGVVGSLT